MPEPPLLRTSDRALAACGIVGVGGFALAWLGSGLAREDYSPVSDAISRLAEVDTANRNWMTAGFLIFGVGVPLYAQALRKAVPGPAWISATLTGLATIGVAATPLGAADTAHYVCATVGYVTLAATPLLAAKTFRQAGAAHWTTWSIACGVASATFLALSALDPAHGLTQRLGLSITDGWIVATAWSMARHRAVPRRRPWARRWGRRVLRTGPMS